MFNDLSYFSPPFNGGEAGFRVNAVFIDGAFRDPTTGEPVNFKSFPGVDLSGAKEGDTLIWNPYTNTFSFAGPNEPFPILVMYPKFGVSKCTLITFKCLN